PLGVVHFVERLLLDGFVEPLVAPIVAHFGMHHILVDGREFIGQELVQDDQQPVIALHFLLLSCAIKALTKAEGQDQLRHSVQLYHTDRLTLDEYDYLPANHLPSDLEYQEGVKHDNNERHCPCDNLHHTSVRKG